MKNKRRKAAINAIWRTIGSLDESLNGNRQLLESEMHILASLLDEFRDALKPKDRLAMAIRIMPMVDMDAVNEGKGKWDSLGNEPHADTFSYFTRALMGMK